MAGAMILIVILYLIPTLVGSLAVCCMDRNGKNRVENYRRKLPFLWITGQMLLWAVFQLITVPLVLLEKPFSTDFSGALTYDNPPWTVVTLFGGVIIMLTVAALLRLLWKYVLQHGKRRAAFTVIRGTEHSKKRWELCLWCVFWGLLLLQLFLAVFMTYGDGDDAFYVAVSTITEESNTMYQKLPYTGGTTILDGRHGLAPFPVWISFLSRVSGIPSVTVAHVAVPLALIPLTYAIYDLICEKLCRGNREKLPLFLVLTEILVIFGDTSFSTVENFMIARSRQGKAALGSIVIPMMIYLFIVILERIQENRKVEWMWWGMLAATILGGCLCSTLGALLLCMLTAIVGILSAICYRKLWLLFPMAGCCLPAVCYGVLYLMLG